MPAQNKWIFFGDHAISAAPFGDNLPGLVRAPRDAVERDMDAHGHPDAPLLSGPETVWVSVAIVLASAAAWVAGA